MLLVGAQPSPWQVLSLISGCDVKSLVVYHAQKVSGKTWSETKWNSTFLVVLKWKISRSKQTSQKDQSPVSRERNVPEGDFCSIS